MTMHVGLIGTIEATARGMMLRDMDGMWWRLTGDVDPTPYVRTHVRVVGVRRGEAAIDVAYCGPLTR